MLKARFWKEVILGVNDDSIEGAFLGLYNYFEYQALASVISFVSKARIGY